MKAIVDTMTFAILCKYHIFQGDRDIRHCGTVKLVNGNELHLMRFVDNSGNRISSLDMIFHGKTEDYASEMMSCERDKEKEMIVEAQEVFR